MRGRIVASLFCTMLLQVRDGFTGYTEPQEAVVPAASLGTRKKNSFSFINLIGG